MRTILRLAVFVPLGLLILFFSMANRGLVKLSLDPFPGGDISGPSFETPLFLVVLASVAIGLLAGGFSSWVGHRPVRRAAKQARAEVKKTRGEIEQLRQQALSSLPSSDDDRGPGRPGRV